MRTVLLLRHAKSSWEDTSLPDFERPLNERGRSAAPLIGEFMRKKGIRPDVVICSPARRTKETIALVLETAGIETELRYDQRIYEASAEQLAEIISQIEGDKTEAMLVGHNPGMENLLERLTGKTVRMPTATLARIRLNIDNWDDVRTRGGQLEWVVNAKELAKL